jgi:hypothetical protein
MGRYLRLGIDQPEMETPNRQISVYSDEKLTLAI